MRGFTPPVTVGPLRSSRRARSALILAGVRALNDDACLGAGSGREVGPDFYWICRAAALGRTCAPRPITPSLSAGRRAGWGCGTAPAGRAGTPASAALIHDRGFRCVVPTSVADDGRHRSV